MEWISVDQRLPEESGEVHCAWSMGTSWEVSRVFYQQGATGEPDMWWFEGTELIAPDLWIKDSGLPEQPKGE